MKKGNPIMPTVRTKQRINVTSDKIIRVTPRRMSPAQRESVQKALDEPLELKVIQPSKSPWAAQTVLVPDGTWRCRLVFEG